VRENGKKLKDLEFRAWQRACTSSVELVLHVGGTHMLQVSSDALQNGNISIPVLIADDSEIVRRCIRHLLSAHTDIAIVGEAANFVQTIQMTKDLDPRVNLLDLHMSDENQIMPQEVKSQLHRGVLVLAISLSNDEDAKELAENLGAAVLLDKMELASTLIPAIMQLGHERAAAAYRFA
jgi:DNA-binding NarL/FixJ family response regulator